MHSNICQINQYKLLYASIQQANTVSWMVSISQKYPSFIRWLNICKCLGTFRISLLNFLIIQFKYGSCYFKNKPIRSNFSFKAKDAL